MFNVHSNLRILDVRGWKRLKLNLILSRIKFNSELKGNLPRVFTSRSFAIVEFMLYSSTNLWIMYVHGSR